MIRLKSIGPILAICLTPGLAQGQDAVPPRAVKVLPVFLVPQGMSAPTEDQTQKLMQHLLWSQTRFRELLRNQATFAIAEEKPRVYQSERGLAFYRMQPEGGAPQMVSELLADLKTNRYCCPYILLVVVMNPMDDFPIGGGRPLNGGVNTGGGVIQLSSFALDRSPNFQSTLQHELGHAFGLPHVDVYGYDMKSNDSIMSYNPQHHTNGFTPSARPGQLIAEDLRALALNQRVFARLGFDPSQDVPRGYSMVGRIVPLGAMKIPNQPDGLKVSTDAGEDYGSKVANVVQGRIGTNKKDGTVTYDPSTMWHSARAKDGWVAVQVEFPYEVELSQLAVHSQHSGEYHLARAVRLSMLDTQGQFRQISEAVLTRADETVALPKAKGRVWRFEFRAGESQQVVLRGLRFYSGAEELFPPLVPYQP